MARRWLQSYRRRALAHRRRGRLGPKAYLPRTSTLAARLRPVSVLEESDGGLGTILISILILLASAPCRLGYSRSW